MKDYYDPRLVAEFDELFAENCAKHPEFRDFYEKHPERKDAYMKKWFDSLEQGGVQWKSR